MVAPINYALDVASPFAAAAQGMQFGATIQAMQAQRDELAAKQAQAKAAEAMRARFFANPNPTMRDAAELAGALPKDQAEAMRPYIEQMSKERQQKQLQFGLQTLHALENNPAVGVKLLRDRAVAERASGREQEAALFDQFAESAEKNGPQAPFKILAAMIGHLPGAKEAMEIAGKSRETQADDEFRAVMAGARTVEDIFDRIPQLSQLGEKGMEYAKNFLTQQRLMEKQAAEGIGLAEQRAEENNAIKKAYGLLKTVMPEGAFELQKIGAGYDIAPSSSFSDIIQTSGGIKIDESKAGMLGIDRETMMAIRGIAQTDPKMAASMIADVVKARIKQQYAPQKAQRMSPAALKLVEAGYEYGSPDFVKQMRQEILAERTGKEKGQGVSITNVMDESSGKEAGKLFDAWYESASSGNQQLRDIDEYEDAVSKAITGPFANTRMKGAQIASMLGLGGEEAVGQTRALIQGLSEMTLSARGMLKGQGSITDSEQKILAQARSGDISMTANEFRVLFGAVRRAVKAKTERDTNMLNRAASRGSEVARMYLDEVNAGAYTKKAKTAPGAPVSVTAPNGQVLTFPSQQAADAFKKAAGIR